MPSCMRDFRWECAFRSLDREPLRKVSKIAPTINIGAIVGGDSRCSEVPDSIAIRVGQVDRELNRSLHRPGKKAHVWTVNDIATMLDMLDLDVDNILTDEQ